MQENDLAQLLVRLFHKEGDDWHVWVTNANGSTHAVLQVAESELIPVPKYDGPFMVVNIGNNAGAVRREQFQVRDAEGRDVAATQFTYTVDGQDGEGPPIEWLRQNAYLLAAAPAMLQALQDITTVLDTLVAKNPSEPFVLTDPAAMSARLKAVMAQALPPPKPPFRATKGNRHPDPNPWRGKRKS